MRIAILGAGFSPIPPPMQGGTEWIVYHQARELAKRGHKILLFAGRGTKENFTDPNMEVLEINLEKAENDPSLTEGSRNLRLEMIILALVSQGLIDRKEDFELILNNMRGEAVFLPIAKLIDKPFVNVMHLNLFPQLANLFAKYKTPIITISKSQRKGFENLNHLATVYNCVDTKKFVFNDKPEDYLLMMATIGRHKNQASAIRVAKKLGMRLVLAGKIRDKDYFEEIKKEIDGEQIKYFGELGFDQKLELYQKAKVFIFPIKWNEPFGLVMIEAMSCGTPVAAFNKGAVPEVVVNGKSGFVVENEEAMEEALKKIESISREDCRKQVEENFTVEKMIDDYEKALLSLSR